ncbi:MAG: ABC transporter [Calditrichaeota bacterium]|nr:MAG: ABC transporter [Calditrichota bacterium]
MKKTVAIFQAEMKHFFYSPIAYVVIALFTVIVGYFFYSNLSWFVEQQYMDMMRSSQFGGMGRARLNVNLHVITPYFFNVALISLFILPLVTMRLYAEEKKAGTVELLYTTPVSVGNIVIGKWLAGVVFYLIMLAPTVVFNLLLFLYGNPDSLPVLAGYLGLVLFGGAFVAVGLWISSLTENQIIAAIGSFGLSLLLWVISWAAEFSGELLAPVFKYLSIINHFEDFARGILDTQHLAYYLLLISTGMFLTFKSIESSRWKA